MDKKDLDNPETTVDRIRIIKNKKLLREVYEDFYKIFKNNSKNLPRGKKIEIGSGAGFLKKVIPDVITSDIMKLPNCDMCFPAEDIPFKNNTVSAYYLLNTFHHIKNPKKALKEFSRTLKRKGRVIMVEPYNSFWGRFVYKYFHHETFDPQADWIIKQQGYLSSANGALAWIIFKRDADEFNKLFPELKIVQVKPNTPFSYLFSGGFSLPEMIPLFMHKTVKNIENIDFINKSMGMFATVVLEKN